MEELKEQLLSCRNLINVANVLIAQGERPDKDSMLATILEYLFQEIQLIIDDYCVFT